MPLDLLYPNNSDVLGQTPIFATGESKIREDVLPAAAANVKQILFTGNSFSEGGGDGGPRSNRFTGQAAYHLGAAEFNFSRDGSVLYRNTDTGAWRASLKRIKPLNADGTLRHPTNGGAWSDTAGGEVAVLCRNMNDQLILGPDNQIPFIEALRTEIVRMRTTALWLGDDSALTYGGTASLAASDTGASDGNYRLLDAGSWVEQVLPAHFPGGWYHVGLISGPSVGGTLTISVNGTVVRTTNTRNLENNTAMGSYFLPVVRRVKLAPGAQTIRITCTARGSGASFGPGVNFTGVESNTPGLVVAMAAHQLTDAGVAAYTSFGSTGGVPWSSQAGTVAQTALIRSLVAEFEDGLVTLFDMNDTMQKLPENFSPDLLHPSELGHKRLGAALASHIARNLPAVRTPRRELWLTVSDPDGYTGSTYATGAAAQGFGTYPGAGFRKEADGTVRFRGFVTRTTALGNGASAPLFALPESYWPDTDRYAACASGTNAGVRGTVHISVTVNGLVSIMADATTPALNGGNSYVNLDALVYKAAK